jgi:hypothetical protein
MSVEDFNIIDLIDENAKLKLDIAEMEDKYEDLQQQLDEYIETTKLLASVIEQEIEDGNK